MTPVFAGDLPHGAPPAAALPGDLPPLRPRPPVAPLHPTAPATSEARPLHATWCWSASWRRPWRIYTAQLQTRFPAAAARRCASTSTSVPHGEEDEPLRSCRTARNEPPPPCCVCELLQFLAENPWDFMGLLDVVATFVPRNFQWIDFHVLGFSHLNFQ
ncbi:hypothetical protein BRADI_1g03605v3 [Brachypodium distachyon]|uniref:Uncharacterized protein n=1 Tax=Brachypodium distachyon TaxID=15368 RepID=A0A2K2DHX7_BRADI|nr:hypothetical protein BRADI_1g03605v3 [Brachypodium distachyon]